MRNRVMTAMIMVSEISHNEVIKYNKKYKVIIYRDLTFIFEYKNN